MKFAQRLTVVAAAMAVVAFLGAACEQEQPAEEKVEDQVEKPAAETSEPAQPEAEEKAE